MNRSPLLSLIVITSLALGVFACGDDTSENTDDGQEQPETLTLEITSPGTDTYHSGVVTITADVTGTVSQVDLYADDALVGSDTEAPWEFTWDTSSLSDGAYALRVESLNNVGDTYSSDPCTFHVDHTAPTGSFADLAMPFLFTASETITILADDEGGVASASLLVDGADLETLTAPPFEFNWDTTSLPDGAVELGLEVTDLAGNSATSQLTGVVVNDGDLVSFYEDDYVEWTIPANWRAVEHHLKVHFEMASDNTRVMGIVQWNQPDWFLDLALGVGTCPHSGVQYAGVEGAGGQLIVTHTAEDLDLEEYVESEVWFIHLGGGSEQDLDEIILETAEVSFMGVLY